MSEEPSAIPLADVFRAANELVSAGLIEAYALGGALAAIHYTEPFTTYDADIIFIAAERNDCRNSRDLFPSAIEGSAHRARTSTRQRFPGSISRRERIDRRSRSQSEAHRI